jgi:hypothetical protein
MTDHQKQVLSCAITYIDAGWSVLPLWSVDDDGKCLCGRADCKSPGKHPHGRLAPNGAKDATNDGEMALKWFSNGEHLNIGICAGEKSKLVILDVDPEHGGDESLAKFGEIPKTPTVGTGGGGRHFYFRHPGGEVRNSAGTIASGLDVRGHNGYVVAPPSLHASGKEYKWLIDAKAQLADTPKWILNSSKQKEKVSTKQCDQKVGEGKRNNAMTALAGKLRRTGLGRDSICAALIYENEQRCNPPLPDDEVMAIANSVAQYDTGTPKHKQDSQATLLVDLAEGIELFHDAEGNSFATVAIADHKETSPIRSKRFRQWLRGLFWRDYHKAPGAQAMQDALGVLSSKAIYEGPELATNVRLAECDGAIWLDLANADWQAIKITAAGWEVVSDPPAKFLRPRGLLPLPAPTTAGDTGLLRQFLNLAGEQDWALLISWMAAALRPTGPFPILVVNGEQGSAKSTLCRLVRAIIDPNTAPLRAMPREVRDLMIAASNSWVLGFDNICRVPVWLSDGFCRMSTGGGFATRELYSDNDEVIIDVQRPVIINGIEELANRSDMLDRSICLTLPTIPDASRRTERQLWAEFSRLRPLILGALLDAVAKGMAKLPTVELTTMPRMADFATWSVATEEALGLAPGSFLAAYSTNREDATVLAIEVSPIGPAVQEFMSDKSHWDGAAQELLESLEAGYASEQVKKRRDWPKSPQAVGKALRRLAPSLRQAGINIEFVRGGGKTRKRLVCLVLQRDFSSRN